MNATNTAAAGQTVSKRLLAGAAAALFGLVIVYVAGFAHPQALHNATHDTRHAFALPCH